MTPANRGLRAARLQLAAAMRLADLDYARNLGEEHVVDLRTVDSSFRILDGQPLPYEESLDHIAESVLARSGSIQASKLVAACAYYLCQETISGYLSIRDRRASPALTSFARRCDRLTGGKDDARLFILWSSLQGGFKEARPAVIAAIARSIGSSCAMPQRGKGWLTPCLALSLAAFASFQKGRNDVTGKLAGQLSDVAESDGYRVIAEMFHARMVRAGWMPTTSRPSARQTRGSRNCLPVTRPGKSLKGSLRAHGKSGAERTRRVRRRLTAGSPSAFG